MKILQIKKTVYIIKYLMYKNNTIINITEEEINELEDGSIAIIQFESEREKERLKIRKNKIKLDSCGNI